MYYYYIQDTYPITILPAFICNLFTKLRCCILRFLKYLQQLYCDILTCDKLDNFLNFDISEHREVIITITMTHTLITPKILIVMVTFNKAALNIHIQDLLWLWTSISLGKVHRSGWLAPVVGGLPPRAAVTNPQRASALTQQKCIFSEFSGWKCKVEASQRLWGGPFWPLPLLWSLSILFPASTPPVSASTVPLLPTPCFRLLRMLTSAAILLGYPWRAPFLKVLKILPCKVIFTSSWD